MRTFSAQYLRRVPKMILQSRVGARLGAQETRRASAFRHLTGIHKTLPVRSRTRPQQRTSTARRFDQLIGLVDMLTR
jgi:hypothetical protein